MLFACAHFITNVRYHVAIIVKKTEQNRSSFKFDSLLLKHLLYNRLMKVHILHVLQLLTAHPSGQPRMRKKVVYLFQVDLRDKRQILNSFQGSSNRLFKHKKSQQRHIWTFGHQVSLKQVAIDRGTSQCVYLYLVSV